jgi:hypothetical protein
MVEQVVGIQAHLEVDSFSDLEVPLNIRHHHVGAHLANTVDASREDSIKITRISTGATMGTGTVDMSSTDKITFSDGTTSTVTNWTLAH